MCLTVCRKRSIIYDNDRTIVCSTCALRTRTKKKEGCNTCQHRQADKRREVCLMTGMGIPTTRWCCHHNARRDLPYFPYRLNEVDGIVLVTDDQFQEANADYLDNNPLVAKRYRLASTPNVVELVDIFDYVASVDNDSLFSTANKSGEISLNDELWNQEKSRPKIDTGGHKLRTLEEAKSGIYVPIPVGKDLVETHRGVGGLIEWFEAIFGGPEDIMLDWKNRWGVHPHRLAVPGVYGIAAEDWSELINDDLTDLLHDLFS